MITRAIRANTDPTTSCALRTATASPINLVVEIKGARDDSDAAKADTMRKAWVPAVNASGQFGRWDFMEFTDAPYDVDKAIRAHIKKNRRSWARNKRPQLELNGEGQD